MALLRKQGSRTSSRTFDVSHEIATIGEAKLRRNLLVRGSFWEAMKDEVAQDFQDFGYRDEYTDVATPNLPRDLVRAGAGDEHDRSRNQWRNKGRERLAE